MKQKLLLFMVLVAMQASALNFTVGNLTYSTTNVAEGKVRCTGLASGASPASILIPGKVTYNGTTYQVQIVNAEAFASNESATVLRIGWGVEYIRSSAFYNTKLKYVYLPSSIKEIGTEAFHYCPLVRVCQAISTSYPIIYNAFEQDRSFKIVINPTITSQVDTSKRAEWVTADDDGTLDVNGALANDFEDDYQYYVITSAVGASTNTAMLVGARNGKTAIDLKNNALCGTNTEYGGSGNFYCRFTAIAEHAFEGNTTITSVGTESDYTPWLEEIGTMAFNTCKSITSVCTNAKKIGNGAFRYCISLSSFTPYNSTGDSNGVQEIGPNAFYNTALTEVYIPTSTKLIDYSAFGACMQLTSFQVSSQNERYYASQGILYDTKEKKLQRMPPASTVTSISWPNWVTRIDYDAFSDNQNISRLSIPYGITTIDDYAFNASKITNLVIPSSVTSIGKDALSGLFSLQKLYFNHEEIPATLKEGDGNTFRFTGAELYVPRGCSTTYAGNTLWTGAFSTIHNGGSYDIETTGARYYTVTGTDAYTDTIVQSEAAAGQAKLVYPPLLHNYYEQLLVENTVSSLGKTYIVTSIDARAFDGYTKLKKINGGVGLKTIPATAFVDCSNLTTVQFRYLETISEQAFYNLKNLKTFIWGENLKTIGDNAFNGCGFDKEIVLPASLTSIGSRAFYNCASLPGLFLSNPTGGTITWQFYGNNAADFTCYVPLKAFYRFSNFATWTVGNGTAADQMHPYLKPETEWSVFSCHKPYALDDDAEYYGIIDYDDSKGMVTTQRPALPGYSYTALLMRATPGTVHRLRITNEGSILATMLKGAYQPNVKVETEANGYTNFVFNPATARFERISGYKYFQPGEAYLEVPTTKANEIQIDLIYEETVVPGDVNGDGIVSGADVTALYGYLLDGKAVAGNADVSGDGIVSGADVTALYNLLLQ